MTPLIFMVVWLLACGAVFGVITALINYDIIMVFVLGALDAPFYGEARRIAWLLHRHPEQWAATSYTLSHAKLGELRGLSPATLSLHGAGFGEWTPTPVERRIVWNAVLWYRREQLRKTLDGAQATRW
jgi:hypothetical protein